MLNNAKTWRISSLALFAKRHLLENDALRRVRKNTLVSLSSQVIVVLSGIVSMYFNSRALGVSGLGHLAFLLAIAALLEKLLTLQTWQVVAALGPGRENVIFGGALMLDLIALLIAAGIGLLIAYISAPEAALLMASIAFRLQDPALGLLRLRNRFGTIAWIEIAQALAATLAAILLWQAGAGLPLYLAFAAALTMVVNLVTIAIAWMDTPPAMPSSHVFREILRFAVPAGLSSTIGTIRQNAIVPLLGVIAGTFAVGLFTVAEKIASVLIMLNSAISQAAFREMKFDTRILVLVTGGIGFAAATVFGALTVFFGESIIQMVAGANFLPALSVLLLLVFASAISLACVGLRAAIIVNSGPAAMLKCDAISATILLFAPLLIDAFGAKGAALTYVAYEAFWLFVAFSMFRKKPFLAATKI